MVNWRVAYWVGGGMGLFLLMLRVGVLESGIFQNRKESRVARGNFFALFSSKARARRYIATVLAGLPIWFAVGILVTLAPDIAGPNGLQMNPAPVAGTAVLMIYAGLAVGDFASGAMSQLWKSRKRVLFAFIIANAVAIGAYFTVGATSVIAFHACVFLLGVANGYWAIFVTVASEQFGTNLRATAATTAPNFVRGALVPMNMAFLALTTGLGPVGAAIVIGSVVAMVAFVAVFGIEETFGKDLDYVEE